eukprot:1141053-Pelagomonas_calceolata.AAC.2
MRVLLRAIGAHVDKFKIRSMSFPCVDMRWNVRKYSELFQTLPGDYSLAQPLLRQKLSVQAASG